MTKSEEIILRNARPSEFVEIGQLMVNVYSQLDGFPKPSEQPNYYKMLLNVGELTKNVETEIIIAVDGKAVILGAVVFFKDMQFYGSGGVATKEKNSAGFRLLAVSSSARGLGVGKLLTMECIKRAQKNGLQQVVIHTTKAMMTAWGMYEKIGFRRSEDLDFMQGDLPVFGFRFLIKR